MLKRLQIENFAIIHNSTIEFGKGLNILTGETGAGKSMLIDSLAMILGGRTDRLLLQNSQKTTQIIADFAQIPTTIKKQLIDHEIIDQDQPDDLLIRKIIKEKSNKNFINDIPISNNLLKTLSQQLLIIYGQHQNQELLKPQQQLIKLDRFAKLNEETKLLANYYKNWQKLIKQLDDLIKEQEYLTEKQDLLNFQAEELKSINPLPNEFSEISKEYQQYSQAENLLKMGDELQQLLSVLAKYNKNAINLSEKLSQKSEKFNEIHQLLLQSEIYLTESEDNLNSKLAKITHDPIRLANLNSRMELLYKTGKKYKTDPDQLNNLYQQINKQINQFAQKQTDQDEIKKQIEIAKQKFYQLAQEVSQKRQQKSQELAQKISNTINQLGMKNAQIIFNHQEVGPSAFGIDDFCLLFSANIGQTPKPLQKIASGGELSRISLAIETACLANDDDPVSVVFDEVDSGIGGEIAHTIGKLLKQLSTHRQVLCITHLPQVACYADHHFLIQKQHNQEQTSTQITALSEEDRIIEIARMLGSASSLASINHAKSLLLRKNS